LTDPFSVFLVKTLLKTSLYRFGHSKVEPGT
jgi:hypothetical protein